MGLASRALLEIDGLSIGFEAGGQVQAVTHGTRFSVGRGRCVGLVGESGSGKSISALAVLRLLPSRARILGGRILFDDRDLLELDEAGMRRVRGREIGMIYQEPMSALNPVFTIGAQIGEVIERHLGLTRRAVEARVGDLLRMVGIPDPVGRARAYPHELSGGLRQRARIAMALSCEPKLVIADEPTTALDVTIQAQILDLLRRLQRELDTAVLLITHDLGVVAELADDVVVMYAGHVVESGPAAQVFESPGHPYTEGLLRSIPRLDTERQRLVTIPGVVPRPHEIGEGCPFAPRCGERLWRCEQEMPPLVAPAPGRRAACWARQPAAAVAADG
jgi:oligopeptide/dipeptide ABC transporter ATP-binding protein